LLKHATGSGIGRRALGICCRIVLAENRFPLFGTML
jgi:hypothetical protein